MRRVIFAAAAFAALASPAMAASVYTNNFDSENLGVGQLNYNGFNGLTVTDGTVDLVNNGTYSITCVGNAGLCVDLDGSTGDSGLTSSNGFSFNAGDRLDLTFMFSGNQRGGANDDFKFGFVFGGPVAGTIGYNSDLYGSNSFAYMGDGLFEIGAGGVPSSQAFSNINIFFIAATAGTADFRFQDLGNDNVGIVIDNVGLSIGAVPEPSTWAMMILGFGVIGAAARRRKAALRLA